MVKITLETVKKVTPQCYAYTLPEQDTHKGWTKIGFTERDVETRVKEQTHTAGLTPKICWAMRASYMTEPYGNFTDKDFHSYLKKLGVNRREGTEWFQIEPNPAKLDFMDFAQNHGELENDEAETILPYTLRQEQKEAVEQTLQYFQKHDKGEFLWNAKPRFGKTLTAYDLCKKIDAKNILIVTNRPAIANSWYADYKRFFGLSSGWCFVSTVEGIKDEKLVFSRKKYEKKAAMDEGNLRGCITFVSLQDLKGSLYFGGHIDKLVELSDAKDDRGNFRGMLWDLLIIDEAHEGVDTYKTDTAFQHIRRKWTLHLSGTPFKALANDKFSKDAIFNWTYADEQMKKKDWDNSEELENPYAPLPVLSLYTYQMSEIIRDKLKQGITLSEETEEFAFDLNEFFLCNEAGKFVHDKEVNQFLDALTKQEKFPFSTEELRGEIKHSFWILNRVASAKALASKLKLHPVFKDYQIILAAGDGKLEENEEEENQKAFQRVTEAIEKYEKTLTLSVGQLTTGITIPEWTAVLMLSNMSSPAQYMQAAFRAQNPCLFTDREGNTFRKKNAYVFDFDPARTLTIFEQFANDLIPKSSANQLDLEEKKRNVKELLNFFPIYAEDDGGQMTLLNAESVLTIPRHIYAKEVVERGFMSNFLFSNISGIFSAPKEVIDLINGFQAIEEPRELSKIKIEDGTKEALYVNDAGEVEIPKENLIGLSAGLFGDKIYRTLERQIEEVSFEIQSSPKEGIKEKDTLDSLQKKYADSFVNIFLDESRAQYPSEIKKSTEKQIERKIIEKTEDVVKKEYADYSISRNQLQKEREIKVQEAQDSGASMERISSIDQEYEKKQEENYRNLVESIQNRLKEETVPEVALVVTETLETEKCKAEKESIEGDVRNHLRGFSRTIPAFLMAYGDRNTTLANFDSLVPEEVFLEVTRNPQTGEGVTLSQFRFLRDGGDYYEKDENGQEIRDEEHKKHFQGQLFDELVFNNAVVEFMNKREELANYFEDGDKGDIFDYIPPQKTNQIFTPKEVVKDMVDRLEKENPGCFDNPDYKFADLYMKSGMYITEIVKRLFQSKRMQLLFPDSEERLGHIFAKQVFGCAPTEIIYRICLRYILGFDSEQSIQKHNIKLCDTLPLAKDGHLEERLRQLF